LDPRCRKKNRRINKIYRKTTEYFARFMNYYHEGRIKEIDKGGTRSMIGDVRNTCKVIVTKPEEKRNLGDRCTDGRVTLKHILNKK
jgi:hypothetical protein